MVLIISSKHSHFSNDDFPLDDIAY